MACEEYLKSLELLQKLAGDEEGGTVGMTSTNIKIQFVVNRVSVVESLYSNFLDLSIPTPRNKDTSVYSGIQLPETRTPLYYGHLE